MEISSAEFWGYVRQIGGGAVVTMQLFVSGFVLALLLGTLIGIVTLSRNIVIQTIWRVYSSIIMGVDADNKSLSAIRALQPNNPKQIFNRLQTMGAVVAFVADASFPRPSRLTLTLLASPKNEGTGGSGHRGQKQPGLV